jgi:hypothetical protein
MLPAEFTIFVELQAIRIVLLVLVGLIIAVFAHRAGQRHRISHILAPLTYFGNSFGSLKRQKPRRQNPRINLA